MALEHLVDNLLVDMNFLELVVDEAHDGGAVTFTVKELLAEQRAVLRDISTKIDLRPTKEDLEHLRTALQIQADGHAGRLDALEKSDIDNRIKWSRVGGMAAVIGAAFGGLAATIVSHLH